jgi:glycerol-3-phosphate dehydrogenase (NAD(P)+)
LSLKEEPLLDWHSGCVTMALNLFRKEVQVMQACSIMVMGAGSWGSSLAIHLAKLGHKVYLWGRDPNRLDEMRSTRCNNRYLPGITFPESIIINQDIAAILAQVQHVVIAVPSQGFIATMQALQPHITSEHKLLLSSKGVHYSDEEGLLPLSEIARKHLGEQLQIAVLSGPSFAIEVAQGRPTAVVVASDNQGMALQWAEIFHSELFRPYHSLDMFGVQIAAAIKNPLAVAVGLADGLKLGYNARSALLTRGLAEMQRLGVALGGKAETFTGLAGMGDLVLTATSDLSRNRRLGLALGQGLSLSQARKQVGQVIESVANVSSLLQASERLEVALPIMSEVHQVILGAIQAEEALFNLLRRAIRSEV